MGISQKTFSEIKDILHKLDRSIEHVREERRRGGAEPAAEERPGRARPLRRPDSERAETNDYADPYDQRIG